MGKEVCQSGMPFFLAQKAGRISVFRFGAWEGITSHGNGNSRKVRIYMNRKRLKRVAAMMMTVVLTVCAATPAGSFAFASGADAQSNTAEESVNKQSLFTQQVCAASSTNIGGLAVSEGRSMTASVLG